MYGNTILYSNNWFLPDKYNDEEEMSIRRLEKLLGDTDTDFLFFTSKIEISIC